MSTHYRTAALPFLHGGLDSFGNYPVSCLIVDEAFSKSGVFCPSATYQCRRISSRNQRLDCEHAPRIGGMLNNLVNLAKRKLGDSKISRVKAFAPIGANQGLRDRGERSRRQPPVNDVWVLQSWER
ncbi:MAG: hypothetical protein Q9215_003222 [Flavoplaca cf. flavocitrina]